MNRNSSTGLLSKITINDDRVVDVNCAFLEMTGYQREEILCKSLGELKDLLKSDFMFKVDDNSLGEYFIFTKQLYPRHVKIYFETNDNGHEKTYKLEKLLDYKFEDKLINIDQAIMLNNSRNENIRNLLNIMDLPIIRVTYPSLNIISVNDRIFAELHKKNELLQRDKNSVVGMNINKIVPGFVTDKTREYLNQMEITKKSVSVNNCQIPLENTTYYVNFIYQPLFDVDNVINEMLIIIIDVTAAMQNQIKLEKILRTQEEFFSYITHEFKTPLSVTYSAIQLLDYFCNDELSERAKRFINKIRQSSLQQLRLVNNLLDITKADGGYLKLNKKNYDIVFMTEAIVNSVMVIAKGKNINLSFSTVVPSKLILIDDEKYERILLNILSNAIKFTPSGKNIFVDLVIDNSFVNVKVKDEGEGIPSDKQSIIFDRFGQVDSGLIRNSEGTGIGLCLAKMLANALGGDITFKSESGKGSEFTILIPNIVTTDNVIDKKIQEALEERLVQSVNVEFSSIYQ